MRFCFCLTVEKQNVIQTEIVTYRNRTVSIENGCKSSRQSFLILSRRRSPSSGNQCLTSLQDIRETKLYFILLNRAHFLNQRYDSIIKIQSSRDFLLLEDCQYSSTDSFCFVISYERNYKIIDKYRY